MAEIGRFSERFARDLFAGQKPFPLDTKKALFALHNDFEKLVKAAKHDVIDGVTSLYIYRTNEQLRASPVGQVWPNAFIGPYRAAMFEVWRWAAQDKFKPVHIIFAEVPDVEAAELESIG